MQRTRGTEIQSINCVGGGFKEEGSQRGSQELDITEPVGHLKEVEVCPKGIGQPW